MEQIAKQFLLSQLDLMTQQIAAIRSMVITISASGQEAPVQKPKDKLLPADVDEALSQMFEGMRPKQLDESDTLFGEVAE